MQRSHKTNCTGLVQSKWLMALVTMDIFPEPKLSEALATDHLKVHYRSTKLANFWLCQLLYFYHIDNHIHWQINWWLISLAQVYKRLSSDNTVLSKGTNTVFGKRPEVIKTKSYWSRNQLRLWLLLLIQILSKYLIRKQVGGTPRQHCSLHIRMLTAQKKCATIEKCSTTTIECKMARPK